MHKFIFFLLPWILYAQIMVGIGKSDITPPIGTPSAGYQARKGAAMIGVHDPLLATAVFINNGEKEVLFCGVDSMGFTYEMVQKLIKKAKLHPTLKHAEIFVMSSHTHSGGGAFLNIPLIGEALAGKYDPLMEEFYIEKTIEAMLHASLHKVPSKIGIGYGKAKLNKYRGLAYPKGVIPSDEIAVIKITQPQGTPVSCLFNYPIHPTVLPAENMEFSSDFVGYARDYLYAYLGHTLQPIFANGAQGDINPLILKDDRFEAAKELGEKLAEETLVTWNKTSTHDQIDIQIFKHPYDLHPKPNPQGLKIPLGIYPTEMNLIVFGKKHAFITIPGELSTIYDKKLKEVGKEIGLHVSILGLTNDSHGYIITPESWRGKAFESYHSFGGEEYGEIVYEMARTLLINFANNN